MYKNYVDVDLKAVKRKPLEIGMTVTEAATDLEESAVYKEYVIDSFIGEGRLSLYYYAHEKNEPLKRILLKEFYPLPFDIINVFRKNEEMQTANMIEAEADQLTDSWNVKMVDRSSNKKVTASGESFYSLMFQMHKRFADEALLISDISSSVGHGDADARETRSICSGKAFKADNGNTYVAVDIKNGQRFVDLIDKGWETVSERGKYRNNLLGEIIGLLLKITAQISHLHINCNRHHLGLSTENVMVSYLNNVFEAEPIIVDYATSQIKNESSIIAEDYFKYNPFSDFTVSNRSDASTRVMQRADDTSDTYSIVAMLFYAVTGEYYTPDKIYDVSWRQNIRRLYPDDVCPDFADKLIGFFSRGLSPNHADRYVTANIKGEFERELLYDALTELKNACSASDVLCCVPDDELMSYVILDKYPLFRYFGKDGDIHVLCVGSGVFVNRMILSMLSIGQMVGHRLNIHVVSGDAEQYRYSLKAQAPLLSKYADLGDGTESADKTYVSITFENVDDITTEDACRNLADAYGTDCRYVVVSLGASDVNRSFAECYGAMLKDKANTRNKTIINYYLPGGFIDGDTKSVLIPQGVELMPFGKQIASYSRDVHKLGLKAFRIHYLYDKLYDKTASRSDVMRKFIRDQYSQRSSAASAVHIDYKIASLGIKATDPAISHRSISSYRSKIIGEYTSCMNDVKKRDLMMQLEHTRWMFYMIADGYRLPTLRDHELYSFRPVSGKFNAAFKCTDYRVKTHHCLVPCDGNGMRLPMSHDEWDRYKSIDEIEKTDYDELDKASLKVHYLAGERIKRSATVGKVRGIVENDLFEKLYLVERGAELWDEYEDFKKWIIKGLKNKQLRGLKERVRRLEKLFGLFGVDISDVTVRLLNELAVFIEFSSYRDYKESDKTIVDHLLRIKFSEEVTMIKCKGRSVISNIASPLIIEPVKLIYLGMEPEATLIDFFKGHGDNTEVFFENMSFDDLISTKQHLERIIAASPRSNFIIDVTDADPIFSAAAFSVSSADSNIGVVSCNTKDFTLTNVMNYPLVPIYKLNTYVSADETFGLFGASKKDEADNYMLYLSRYIDTLGDFYLKQSDKWRNGTDSWQRIADFFMTQCRTTPEVSISHFTLKSSWSNMKLKISPDRYYSTGLAEVMRKLELAGIIKNVTISETEADCTLSLSYRGVVRLNDGTSFNPLKDDLPYLFERVSRSRFTCRIDSFSNGEYHIEISSGLNVNVMYHEDENIEKRVADLEYMKPHLRALQESGIITDLDISTEKNNTYLYFTYRNTAIRDCFAKGGNILEAYVWSEAEKTGFFDSVQSNYSFSWSNPNVTNELDVVLTHGMTTLVCSCKSGRIDKNHLYEIAALTNQFSVNTKPVLICSAVKTRNDTDVYYDDQTALDYLKERAKEMGIYMVMRETVEDDLGAELIRIAEGTV